VHCLSPLCLGLQTAPVLRMPQKAWRLQGYSLCSAKSFHSEFKWLMERDVDKGYFSSSQRRLRHRGEKTWQGLQRLLLD
jgi:hypothetical protein